MVSFVGESVNSQIEIPRNVTDIENYAIVFLLQTLKIIGVYML